MVGGLKRGRMNFRAGQPHMHILKAMPAYYEATECENALGHTTEVFHLFQARFFQPATGIRDKLGIAINAVRAN